LTNKQTIKSRRNVFTIAERFLSFSALFI